MTTHCKKQIAIFCIFSSFRRSFSGREKNTSRIIVVPYNDIHNLQLCIAQSPKLTLHTVQNVSNICPLLTTFRAIFFYIFLRHTLDEKLSFGILCWKWTCNISPCFAFRTLQTIYFVTPNNIVFHFSRDIV